MALKRNELGTEIDQALTRHSAVPHFFNMPNIDESLEHSFKSGNVNNFTKCLTQVNPSNGSIS